MSKEDKFFESLRDFAGFTGRVGFLLEETAEGRMAVSESYKECSDIKMKCRESYGLLMERMYKAYKDPSQLDNARGLIERMYHIVDISKAFWASWIWPWWEKHRRNSPLWSACRQHPFQS